MNPDQEDRETALMLAAQMKPTSIAQMLGRTVEWVQDVLAPPAREVDGQAVEALGYALAANPPASAPVVIGVDLASKRDVAAVAIWRPGYGMQLLKSVTPDIIRWTGWFLDAGWRLPTVADLFDVDQDQLSAALAEVSA